jgi:hypothetical protein
MYQICYEVHGYEITHGREPDVNVAKNRAHAIFDSGLHCTLCGKVHRLSRVWVEKFLGKRYLEIRYEGGEKVCSW